MSSTEWLLAHHANLAITLWLGAALWYVGLRRHLTLVEWQARPWIDTYPVPLLMALGGVLYWNYPAAIDHFRLTLGADPHGDVALAGLTILFSIAWVPGLGAMFFGATLLLGSLKSTRRNVP